MLMIPLFKMLCIVMCSSKSETKKILQYEIHSGHQIKSTDKHVESATVRSSIECTLTCSAREDCCTSNYNNMTHLCSLFTDCCPETEKSGKGAFIHGKFVKPVEQEKPKDCSEISTGNGVYTIYPETSSEFEVYCKNKWTVIQKRIDGTTDFYRTWEEYKTGFGAVSGNYWLGNERIHILSRTKSRQLRIELTDFNDTKAHANCNLFRLGNEASKYTLTVCGYSGTAGDMLEAHAVGTKFTTKDQDNDDAIGYNCAHSYKAGWWFTQCTGKNLNGPYMAGRKGGRHSMSWEKWRGETSLKTSHIMIR